jgi:ketosteroid isomerase-like protein
VADENVDVVRRFHDAWNDGGVAAVHDPLHPDIEWYEAPEMPGGGSHSGRPAVEDYLQSLIDTVGQFRADQLETAVAGDLVITVLRTHESVTPSGVPFDFTITHVYEIRDGQLACVRVFFDRDAAFAAAGIDA